ncbi:UNKNOWN [Stylonychia lemnae]|uniref:Uncharacterized protein n=1 Tax=Stylonychia lemnae TaxID=5949 RepID=A0A078A2F5_STYLE|nr:UNKNOWN [Stylonychia lemnae]|eukprot:CDW75708.1 UNKNOWN [Stylonychia lemnae]
MQSAHQTHSEYLFSDTLEGDHRASLANNYHATQSQQDEHSNSAETFNQINREHSVFTGAQLPADIQTPCDSIDEDDEDQDIELYNSIFNSHLLFKQSFELEMHQYKLALHNSIADILTRLPKEIRQMSAENFLIQSSENNDFDNQFNLSFRVVDNSSLDLLKSVSQLFQAKNIIQIQQQNQYPCDHNENKIIQQTKSQTPFEPHNNNQNQQVTNETLQYDASPDQDPIGDENSQNTVCQFQTVSQITINQKQPDFLMNNDEEEEQEQEQFIHQNENSQQRQMRDQEIQCRFSMRISTSSINRNRDSMKRESRFKEQNIQMEQVQGIQVLSTQNSKKSISHQALQIIGAQKPENKEMKDDSQQNETLFNQQAEISRKNSISITKEKDSKRSISIQPSSKSKQKQQLIEDLQEAGIYDNDNSINQIIDPDSKKAQRELDQSVNQENLKPKKKSNRKKVARRAQTKKPALKKKDVEFQSVKKVNTRAKNRNQQNNQDYLNDSHVLTRSQYRESLSSSRQNSAIKVTKIGMRDIDMIDESQKEVKSSGQKKIIQVLHQDENSNSLNESKDYMNEPSGEQILKEKRRLAAFKAAETRKKKQAQQEQQKQPTQQNKSQTRKRKR